MEAYDLVYGSCDIDDSLRELLGFKRVLVAGKEMEVVDADEKESGFEGALAIGRDVARLFAAVRGRARAVAIIGARIDRRLLEEMAKEGTVLCMPAEQLTSCTGLERTKRTYFMRKLFSAARKRGIHVSFVSLAKDRLQLDSYMQLIEIAKHMGATEQYARYSLGEVNRSLVEA